MERPGYHQAEPGVKLPDQNIAVVRRADGSGTSFVFTSYLSKANAQWKEKIGAGSTVNWPTGLGGKGNDGIAAFVQRLPGSIGYVEYAYAKQNNPAYTKLVSADGKPVSPTEESFSNAAKGVDWSKTFAQDLTDQKGDNVWPITSTTFIPVHKEQKNPAQGAEVLKFFDWAYKTGGKQANELDYATLPKEVVEQVRAARKTNVKTVQVKRCTNNAGARVRRAPHSSSGSDPGWGCGVQTESNLWLSTSRPSKHRAKTVTSFSARW